ncbi:DUF4367 domain-containing protein [Intestinimonas butyriciproducens]|uniref:DUF4367 domain-containing protein n=1 Tax=Intestinimonas butyriciproducens TaxID=1297617 RepID=UPI00195AA7BD|nr:DUF4367 domain-containing protein [Intestinimonas butyriciproducens]MBM6974982.1 DUF4367 domain-containing protein [Intestinimonas butyriciproducens]
MKITDEMLFEHAAEARNIWLNTLPSQEELPVVSYSKSFERKMKKLIKEQRRSPKTNKIIRYLKQTVAAVLAVAIVTFGGLMTVEAYRAKVVEFVIQVFDKFTQFTFYPNQPETNIDDYSLPEISFGYIPEGMIETENRITSTGRHFIRYENGSNGFFQLTQSIVADGQYNAIVDTEDSDYKVGTINGFEAFFNTKNGQSTIIWINGDIVCKLFGTPDLNELKLIAEKIKIFSD